MILTYDTETTGFPETKRSLEEQPRIVQLGAVLDYPDGREAMRLDAIIRVGEVPANVLHSWTVGRDNDGGAARIHGITPEISEKIGITEEIVFDMFLDMVAVADVIVGHNHVWFDNKVTTNVVRRVYKKADADPFANKKMFDTIEAGKLLMKLPSKQGGYRKPKLIDLHTHLTGQGFEDAHTAIADVLATRRCHRAMLKIAEEAIAKRGAP